MSVKEKPGKINLEGIVASCAGNGFFNVKVDEFENPVLCRLAGKMNQNKIKVVEGDKVEIEVDGLDLTRGRITFRKRK